MDIRTDGRMDGRTDGWMDRQTSRFLLYSTGHCPFQSYCPAYFRPAISMAMGREKVPLTIYCLQATGFFFAHDLNYLMYKSISWFLSVFFSPLSRPLLHSCSQWAFLPPLPVSPFLNLGPPAIGFTQNDVFCINRLSKEKRILFILNDALLPKRASDLFCFLFTTILGFISENQFGKM